LVTKEERLELGKKLDERKTQHEILSKSETEDLHQWDQAIGELKKGLTLTEDLELPGGRSIQVRTHLSETEEIRLSKLVNAWGKGNKEAAYKIVELVTASSDITAEWLKEHPDEFSVTDAIDVMLGVFEKRAEQNRARVERIKRLTTFREEQPGTEPG